MIKAHKIFTGEDGHTHIEHGFVAENQPHEVQTVTFKETSPRSVYDWHTAPVDQYVITLSGTLQFETFLGETFIIRPGEVLLALDTTGSGHKWKLIDDQPWKRAYVTFNAEIETSFFEAE